MTEDKGETGDSGFFFMANSTAESEQRVLWIGNINLKDWQEQ